MSDAPFCEHCHAIGGQSVPCTPEHREWLADPWGDEEDSVDVLAEERAYVAACLRDHGQYLPECCKRNAELKATAILAGAHRRGYP